jgi:signal transduction histidine kinase
MIWYWIRRRPLLVDLGLVGLLLLLSVGGAVRRDHQQALGAALAVAETLPLLWRRSRPLPVLALVNALALAMIATNTWLLPLQLGVALYTVAADRQGRSTRGAAAASIGTIALALPLASGLQFGDMATRVVFLVAAFLFGDTVGSRRAYIHEIEEKAERLEHERETETRRAAAEEQARIARELHDVVAHALSVIVVQASAANDAFKTDPRLVQEPIDSIETAARRALSDLRRVLGVLNEGAEYAPQPGLDRLDELIEQVRATGLEVELEVRGDAQPLPAAVDLSAYRIIQEALTNTLKHAQAEHARVSVRYGNMLRLEVTDDGHGSNGNTPGSGLVGMSERVSLLGGTIQTGPAPGGGYRVTATIPAGDVA